VHAGGEEVTPPMTQAEAWQRFGERVPPQYRFVDPKTMTPVPPFGWHYPWIGRKNTCAMCEMGYEDLSKPDTKPCQFEWPTD